ncbi:MAG: alpha/beta fold hydrolase [Pseudomonadota bacterium]
MKPRIVYVHGNQTTHWSQAWAAWLKRELQNHGYPVFFETFPDSVAARAEYWLAFLKEHICVGEKDVLVGWSSGAVAAMRYAEMRTILGSVLVAPCSTHLNNELEQQSGYYAKPWAWNRIRANQNHIAMIYGGNDPFIPQAEFDTIGRQLQARRIFVRNGGHFLEQERFPELLAYLLETYS